MNVVDETPAEREAAELVNRLSARGITLHDDAGRIKWSTDGVRGLTMAEVRAIKRLTPELRALLELCAGFDRATDGSLADRTGGAA